MVSVEELFRGRHFEREVIILRVRWCLRFKLRMATNFSPSAILRGNPRGEGVDLLLHAVLGRSNLLKSL